VCVFIKVVLTMGISWMGRSQIAIAKACRYGDLIIRFVQVSMMSMPSSLIGFAIFKALAKNLEFPFTPVENGAESFLIYSASLINWYRTVLVQTVAVAVGSMPLSAGFVGVIPALEKLLRVEEGGPLNLSVFQLIIWSMGVAFFGVFFAVPCKMLVIFSVLWRGT